jgi:glycosyltransferase involved in cell wall biosynthesis
VNVLGILPGYPPRSRVGAFITTHLFLAHLAAKGHRVRVLLSKTVCDPYDLDGVEVSSIAVGDPPAGPIPNWPIVHEHGDWADVILSNAGDDYGQGVANRAMRPSVRFAHAIAARNTHGADLVIANSRETAATVTHGRVMVIPPPIHPADYATTPGDCVTLVNLSPWKGGPLFWWLAERLPEIQFLGVLGSYGDQGAAALAHLGPITEGNVTIVPPTDDMRTVYSRTRVLLMPSLVESYGRTAMEAACSGIPTIANPTPGLLEAMGADGAVWRGWDQPDSWVSAIRALLEPKKWKVASKAAKARADQLDPIADLDRFTAEVEALVGVPA